MSFLYTLRTYLIYILFAFFFLICFDCLNISLKLTKNVVSVQYLCNQIRIHWFKTSLILVPKIVTKKLFCNILICFLVEILLLCTKIWLVVSFYSMQFVNCVSPNFNYFVNGEYMKEKENFQAVIHWIVFCICILKKIYTV